MNKTRIFLTAIAFFLLLASSNAAVCNNFVRIYAQTIEGVTLTDQARVWDRNGLILKTVRQTPDSNFSCIGQWGEEIAIPVFAGEGLKYRGDKEDSVVLEYASKDNKIQKTLSIADERFSGLRMELLDVNIMPDADSKTVFPEDGFIRFKSNSNACKKNELFLSACACSNDCEKEFGKECMDRKASPNTFSVCGNFDKDACLEWSTPQSCPIATPSCDANANCAPKCTNDCTEPGKRECFNLVDAPNQYRECGNYDDDECFEWSSSTQCPAKQESCNTKGECASDCLNECPASGARKCVNTTVDPNLYAVCGNYDADLCLEWSNSSSCASLKPYCDSNANCACIDTCPKKGLKECVDTTKTPNNFRLCDNFDKDSCLEWGPVQTCSFDKPVCDANGECKTACTPECRDIGRIVCEKETTFPNSFRKCGNYDSDVCPDLGEIETCSKEAPICNDANKQCVADTCIDECKEDGARKCADTTVLPNTFRECGNFDKDSCLEWGLEQACQKTAPACGSEGSCLEFCFNECSEKREKKCSGTEETPNTFIECGNFDTDPCYEWGKEQKCPESQPVCNTENKCTEKTIEQKEKKNTSDFSNSLERIFSPFNDLLQSIFKLFRK